MTPTVLRKLQDAVDAQRARDLSERLGAVAPAQRAAPAPAPITGHGVPAR